MKYWIEYSDGATNRSLTVRSMPRVARGAYTITWSLTEDVYDDWRFLGGRVNLNGRWEGFRFETDKRQTATVWFAIPDGHTTVAEELDSRVLTVVDLHSVSATGIIDVLVEQELVADKYGYPVARCELEQQVKDGTYDGSPDGLVVLQKPVGPALNVRTTVEEGPTVIVDPSATFLTKSVP